MRFPRGVALVAAVVLALVLVAGALGQDGLLANLVQPLVVNIEQQVPVDVTLAVPLEDGTVVTATAPITVGIALQVKIDGSGVVAVEVGEAEPAAVAVEEGAGGAAGAAGVDARGVAYETDVREPFELTQVASTVDALDDIGVVGEVRNTGDAALEFVKAIVTFYQDGKIVAVGEGYTSLDILEPGQSSPFSVNTQQPADEVDAYVVQVQGREAD